MGFLTPPPALLTRSGCEQELRPKDGKREMASDDQTALLSPPMHLSMQRNSIHSCLCDHDKHTLRTTKPWPWAVHMMEQKNCGHIFQFRKNNGNLWAKCLKKSVERHMTAKKQEGRQRKKGRCTPSGQWLVFNSRHPLEPTTSGFLHLPPIIFIKHPINYLDPSRLHNRQPNITETKGQTMTLATAITKCRAWVWTSTSLPTKC